MNQFLLPSGPCRERRDNSQGEMTVTGGGVAAAVPKRKAIAAIVNVLARVIHAIFTRGASI
jgi:hypothetical protein